MKNLKEEHDTHQAYVTELHNARTAINKEIESSVPETLEKIANAELVPDRLVFLLTSEAVLARGLPAVEAKQRYLSEEYRTAERAARQKVELEELARIRNRIAELQKCPRKITCGVSMSTMYVSADGNATIVTPEKKIIELGKQGSVEYANAVAPYKALGWFL
jgi:hypothetical protein